MLVDKFGYVVEWFVFIFAATVTLVMIVVGVFVGCSWFFKKEPGYERL